MSDPANHRKVYARGLFDGLRKAGIDNPEEFMNQARQQSKENNLSGIQRKIYECTPIKSPWHVSQICTEVYRATGSRCERKTVDDCLMKLTEMGLCKEFKQGHFMRVEARIAAKEPEKVVASPVEECNVIDIKKIVAAVEKVGEERKAAGPMDRLAAVAGELRSLANVIEEIACDVEQSMQQANEKTAKLRQLQELLRGLGQ